MLEILSERVKKQNMKNNGQSYFLIDSIRKYMKKKKIKQNVMCEKLETNRTTFWRCMNGKQLFDLGQIYKIAEILEVPPYKLFMTSEDLVALVHEACDTLVKNQ